MARRGVLFVLLFGILGGLLAGCGGGPSAEEWAGEVCAALTPWRSEIATLNAEAQEQMKAATTPQQTQANLVRLLSGAESASERARAAVAEAGTPDVDGGAEVARRFVASLTTARDAYAHARKDLSALPTADAKAFYDSVVVTFRTLTAEYARSDLDTNRLESVDLRKAFDEVAACR